MVSEATLLKNWKLKLGILFAIISPTVTGTAAYYKLQIQLNEKNQQTEERVSRLELDTTKNFADKGTMESMRRDVNEMRNDITEIKTLLRKKLR